MTPSFFTTRTGSLCACCLVMFLFGSRTWRIRQAQNSKSRSLGGSKKKKKEGGWGGGGGGGGLRRNRLRRGGGATGRGGAAEQLRHGEPHPGNLLRTKNGLLFADLETCCRGPVEFDVAHVPEEVSEHYPDADRDLLGVCPGLMLAMIAAWRWDRDDQFPHGRRMGTELLSQVRAARDRQRELQGEG